MTDKPAPIADRLQPFTDDDPNPRTLRRRARAKTECIKCGEPTRSISGQCVECMPPPTVTHNARLGVINLGGALTLSITNAGKVSDALADLLDAIDAEGHTND